MWYGESFKLKIYYLFMLADGRCSDGENDKFYPGDDEETYASYGLIVNAWMPLPEPYRQNDEGDGGNA